MIGCLPTQFALAFLAVFVYATHATQAIAFGWKTGFRLIAETDARPLAIAILLVFLLPYVTRSLHWLSYPQRVT